MPHLIPLTLRMRRHLCGPISAVFAMAAFGLSSLAGAKMGNTDVTISPLAARAQSAVGPLFREVPSTESRVAVENRYDDPHMWSDRFQEFSVGSVGTGIAAADYDGDGFPDLLVVSKLEGARLFRNLGNWKFRDVTREAGINGAAGFWYTGVSFVDINNDGKWDLYLCRVGAPNLLFVNRGDGSFQEEAAARGLAVNDASVMASFFDYDRDGFLDVYVQTNLLDAARAPEGQPDFLFHNRGDGTFEDVTSKAGIRGVTQGHSATWWDYDGDGWPDLYVANDFAAPDNLYHNNRDGTFTDAAAQVLPHIPYSAMGSDSGDLNNDGRVDFFVADMAATTREKDQRGMIDSRARAKETGVASPLPQYTRNALFLNEGNGVVREAAFLAGIPATDWTWSVRLEDLDNDGRLDVHVTNGMVRELHNTDLLSAMMTAESPVERVRLMQGSPPLVERHLVYRNLGDLQFEECGARWGLDQKGVSFGAASADFDRNGTLDLAYVNYQGNVTLLRNTGSTGHALEVELRGVHSNRFGVGSRVVVSGAAGEQVRVLSLARGYQSSSEPMLHFGLGSQASPVHVKVIWPDGKEQDVKGVAADSRLVVTEDSEAALPEAPVSTLFVEAATAFLGDTMAKEAFVDETARQPLLSIRHNARGPAVAIAQAGAGGRHDVVLGGTTQTALQLWRQQPSGDFAPEQASGIPVDRAADDGPILAFDANGDGAADLLISKGGAGWPAGSPVYQPQLWLNDGNGRFAQAEPGLLPKYRQSAGALVAADWDHSGQLGIFIGGRLSPGAYPVSPTSAVWQKQGSAWSDVTDTVAPGLRTVGMVTGALWTDVDGDGWVDLVLTLDWGTIQYWHNEGGVRLVNCSLESGFTSAGTGWWGSLAAGDYNGDGRPDFVAGNLGLNTPYAASASQPLELYSGDFRGSGGKQLIEAGWANDVRVPLRPRRHLGAAIPSLLKKYPKNNDFAKASLMDLFGEISLGQASVLRATEFASGVLLSQPDGTYRFSRLPRIAQIAPLQGVVSTDVDGDGNLDVVCVQNSYAPVPFIGRFDGGVGQVLLGDGHGGFKALSPAESGWVTTGDARALVRLPGNGSSGERFLATFSNAPVRLLQLRSTESAGLHVFLVGPPGNPSGAGARVVLEFEDGSSQAAEVYLGSGYYAQGTCDCRFTWPPTKKAGTLRVLWPDGTRSAVTCGPAQNSLTLRHAEAPNR